MNQQNYSNHKRYYYPHHFIFYPISLIILSFCIYAFFKFSENKLIWLVLSLMMLILIFIAFIMRQHYALTLQNRLIKLEMNFRYFRLTNKDFSIIESKISKNQLFSLRFASDEEFIELIEKVLTENLSPDQIKKEVKYWKADKERV
jgi:c-di-AMP phosphodiesterase-like protein